MRIEGWENRFAELLESKRHQIFSWGENDCCLFAADFIKAICGKDFMKDLRGKYSSEHEAQAVIDKYGDLTNTLECLLVEIAQEVKNLNMLQRGDVVTVRVNGKLAVGILDGKDALVPTPDQNIGYYKFPIRYITKAWRVV